MCVHLFVCPFWSLGSHLEELAVTHELLHCTGGRVLKSHIPLIDCWSWDRASLKHLLTPRLPDTSPPLLCTAPFLVYGQERTWRLSPALAHRSKIPLSVVPGVSNSRQRFPGVPREDAWLSKELRVPPPGAVLTPTLSILRKPYQPSWAVVIQFLRSRKAFAHSRFSGVCSLPRSPFVPLA